MKDTETNHYSTWEPLASLQYKGKQQRIQRYNLGRMSWKEELRSQVRRVRSGKFHTEWSNQDISWLNDKCEGFKKSFRHSGKQRPVSLVRGRSQVGFKLLHGNSSAQRPWSRDHDPQRKTRGPKTITPSCVCRYKKEIFWDERVQERENSWTPFKAETNKTI